MSSWIILVLTPLLALACSTKHVGVHAPVKLLEVNSDIRVTVTGTGVDPDVLDDLRRYLKAKVIIAGFNIEEPAEDALSLEVDVQRFDPGNAALRLTVGFGAGRGSLIYSARYVDHEGRVLASMDGQERFTGSEPHFNMEYGQLTTLQGDAKVRSVLVQEAAKHIVELGLGETRSKPTPSKKPGMRR